MLDWRLKYRSYLQQKGSGVIQKVCSLKTSNFRPVLPCSSLFILHAGCLWIFERKNEEWKDRKELFFYRLNIKDDNVFFFYTDIYTIVTIKIFTCSYIKKSLKKSLCLFKLLATTKQLIRKNSNCCWKNQAIFFTEWA